MVSHQDEALGVEQRPQTDGLADLRRLVHDAEIEAAAREYGMFDSHAGGCHNQLA